MALMLEQQRQAARAGPESQDTMPAFPQYLAVASGMREPRSSGGRGVRPRGAQLYPSGKGRGVSKGRFPGPAGGIATPADAALMMQLGAESIFVGSGIFKSEDPARQATATVKAATHYRDAEELARISEEVGEPMPGIEIEQLDATERMQERGW